MEPKGETEPTVIGIPFGIPLFAAGLGLMLEPKTTPSMTSRPVSRTAAARTLLRHDMPLAEVRAVLGASDPTTVRRYLELHRERLEERFVDGRRALATLERWLVDRLETTACANGSA